MSIDYMNRFGKEGIFDYPDLDTISSLYELPKVMQLLYQDISPEASMASFICYCTEKKIPNKYIMDRSGFTEDEILRIVEEAKKAGIYMQLCKGFLK